MSKEVAKEVVKEIATSAKDLLGVPEK